MSAWRFPRRGGRFIAAALLAVLAGCAAYAPKTSDAGEPRAIPLPDPASGVAPGPGR